MPNRGIWGTAGIDGKNIDGCASLLSCPLSATGACPPAPAERYGCLPACPPACHPSIPLASSDSRWLLPPAAGAAPCRAIANDGDYDKFTRKVERVDEVVKEDVLIMKVRLSGLQMAGWPVPLVLAWRREACQPACPAVPHAAHPPGCAAGGCGRL